MILILFKCDNPGCKKTEIKYANGPEDDQILWPDKLHHFPDNTILCKQHAKFRRDIEQIQWEKEHPGEVRVLLA
jgi:hypothetical protein